jgi:hypothetical protein
MEATGAAKDSRRQRINLDKSHRSSQGLKEPEDWPGQKPQEQPRTQEARGLARKGAKGAGATGLKKRTK